uniref:Protein SPT2 homolog n=1 Tax=Clastoptera arizonana TaxID=38151 RepID=A0A1B6BXM4_9HEMI
MDFGSLLYEAQRNERSTNKDPIRCYKTTFEPPKKDIKEKKLSVNIKKFLEKKEQEERKKNEEARKKKEELLALRSQDKKSYKRVQTMLKRTKSANKSVMEDAIDDVNTAVTMAGPAQPDEDDYGYVSQEASAFYNKLMDKYAHMPPEEPKFSQAKKTSVKNLNEMNAAKERVRQALNRVEEEEMMPHKRKRKSKTDKFQENNDDFIDDNDYRQGSCKQEVEPPPKKKPKRPMAPPPLDFNSLLKIAEQKQFEPIIIEKKVEEEERPLTKKQKLEYEKERDWKVRKLERENEKFAGKEKINTKPSFNRIPKLSETQNKIPKLSETQNKIPKLLEPLNRIPKLSQSQTGDDRRNHTNDNFEKISTNPVKKKQFQDSSRNYQGRDVKEKDYVERKTKTLSSGSENETFSSSGNYNNEKRNYQTKYKNCEYQSDYESDSEEYKPRPINVKSRKEYIPGNKYSVSNVDHNSLKFPEHENSKKNVFDNRRSVNELKERKQLPKHELSDSVPSDQEFSNRFEKERSKNSAVDKLRKHENQYQSQHHLKNGYDDRENFQTKYQNLEQSDEESNEEEYVARPIKVKARNEYIPQNVKSKKNTNYKNLEEQSDNESNNEEHVARPINGTSRKEYFPENEKSKRNMLNDGKLTHNFKEKRHLPNHKLSDSAQSDQELSDQNDYCERKRFENSTFDKRIRQLDNSARSSSLKVNRNYKTARSHSDSDNDSNSRKYQQEKRDPGFEQNQNNLKIKYKQDNSLFGSDDVRDKTHEKRNYEQNLKCNESQDNRSEKLINGNHNYRFSSQKKRELDRDKIPSRPSNEYEKNKYLSELGKQRVLPKPEQKKSKYAEYDPERSGFNMSPRREKVNSPNNRSKHNSQAYDSDDRRSSKKIEQPRRIENQGYFSKSLTNSQNQSHINELKEKKIVANPEERLKKNADVWSKPCNITPPRQKLKSNSYSPSEIINKNRGKDFVSKQSDDKNIDNRVRPVNQNHPSQLKKSFSNEDRMSSDNKGMNSRPNSLGKPNLMKAASIRAAELKFQRSNITPDNNKMKLGPSGEKIANSVKTNQNDVRPRQLPPKDLKPKQFPPPDLKPKQFPPSDLKPRQFPPSDVRRRPKPPVKRRIIEDSEEEIDSEMDDFIDDNTEDQADYSKYISEIFGYDKSRRYANIEEDDECMESSFAQQMREDIRSTKIGIMEDLEDIKKEKEEKMRALRKKVAAAKARRKFI